MFAGPTPATLRKMATDIETLDIETAAAFAYVSVPWLRRTAAMGNIPGACRVGRRWCFIKADLLVWMRAGSPCTDEIKGGQLCRLREEMVAGTLTSPLREQDEYAALLGLQTVKITKQPRKSGTISSRQNYGVE